MAAKKKAAKAGAGAIAAGAAARDNKYVQRVIEDPELREDLRSAFESARKAYGRASGKSATKAFEDKKVQRELKRASESLRSASEGLRAKKKKRKFGLGKLLVVGIVGAGLALAVSEDLRKKVLDGLFGAEEEFEYTSSTTPDTTGNSSSASSEEKVGA